MDGGVEVAVAAGGFAGICAGGLAGLAGGAGEVAAAGGVAGGLRQRARNEERQPDERPRKQNPQHHATGPDTEETRFMRGPDRFTIHIKVTNLSPRLYCGIGDGFFAHYAA